MPPTLTALLIGIVSGSRAMTGPAATAWAARLGWLNLRNTPFAFLGSNAAVATLTALAAGELVADKLPFTASRTVPVQSGARLASGGFCGAAIGARSGTLATGILAGLAGALLGTYGGASARARLAGRLHRDLPAALLEDATALAGAALVLAARPPRISR
jgi:uncharacterized membrane protein